MVGECENSCGKGKQEQKMEQRNEDVERVERKKMDGTRSEN